MLGRHDVGHRVVIRRNAGLRDHRPLLSDVVGELTEFTETHVTVVTRHGSVVLERASIVTGRRIPDQRRRTATEVLEAVAAAGWPAPQTEPLGDWLLRAADGWTSRGNSALAIGEPGRPLAAAVDAVERWYAARGAIPAITVPEPVGGRVARELTGRGWTPAPAVRSTRSVLTSPVPRGQPAAAKPSATASASRRASASEKTGTCRANRSMEIPGMGFTAGNYP